MSRRRRKMFLRYLPSILTLGLAAGIIFETFGGEIVEQKTYEKIADDVLEDNTETVESESEELEESSVVESEVETEEQSESEFTSEVEIPEEVNRYPISDELLLSGYEFQNIDFAKLKERNEDVDAWITIDNTNINYPVMYAPDKEEDYYLHRDIDGKKSSSGTLYTYSQNNSLDGDEADLSDLTMIFGHHMRGDKMFAQVYDYSSQAYYEKHPYGIVYTPDGYAYKATFFAGIITPGGENSNVYASYFTDEEMYADFIDYLKIHSTFESDEVPEFGDKLIALVTCEYTGGTNSRYILYGILNKQYTNELQYSNNDVIGHCLK